jgi:hypothetical protein
VSCWDFSGHSSFFAEARRKDENERPQTIQRHQISKMVSPTRSPARPDARVQHVNFQFRKQSGMHLQFASAAREYLVMKRTTFLAFFLSHGGGREAFGLCIAAQRNVESGWVMPAGYIEPRKIVFHRRRVPHQTRDMNWPQELAEDSQIWPRKPARLPVSFRESAAFARGGTEHLHRWSRSTRSNQSCSTMERIPTLFAQHSHRRINLKRNQQK